MDITSFIFGFISALVFVGVTILLGVVWWTLSYMRYKSQQDNKQQGKGTPIRISRRPPYISETDKY